MEPIYEMFSVRDKTVLVTGGSRGIGRMVARGFVEAGANVYLSARTEQAAMESAAELSAYGRCEGMWGDISTEDGCRKMCAEFTARESRLHVLVNNAGLTLGAALDDFDDAAWEKVLAVNLKAVLHMVRFLRAGLEAGVGEDDPARVINVGSVDGLHIPPMENYSYTASKAAAHHLTRHLAKRLGPAITVNAVAPGPFESDMLAGPLSEAIASHAPMKRSGHADDITGLVVYLASRASAFLTGTVIPLDGGLVTTA